MFHQSRYIFTNNYKLRLSVYHSQLRLLPKKKHKAFDIWACTAKAMKRRGFIALPWRRLAASRDTRLATRRTIVLYIY